MFKSKIYLVVIALSLFKLQATAQEAPPRETLQLNLKETLEYALENNVDAKNAKLELLIAETTVKEELSKGLPQINGSFNFNYNPAIQVIFLPNEPPFGDPSIDSDVIPARFGVSYQSGLGVTASQMLFDGSFFVGLRASKTLRELTEYDRIKTENDVLVNVKKAYFGVLVNKERIKLAEANLTRIDSLLDETKAIYEAGLAEKIDVSRIQVQRNNTYTQVERSRTAYEISKQLLKIQMGLPKDYDILITETLADLNPGDQLNQLLTMEGVTRVEVSQLEKNLELVGLDLRNNTVQYIPKITLNANYQRSGASNELGNIYDNRNWFSSSLLGVTMQIPIFDGFLKSARIQRNRIQLDQLNNQRYFLDDNISLEIFQAKTNLKNDLNIMNVQKENMALAQEVYDISKIKYNEGVGSNLEVVEADAALIESEINYLGALYDGLISKVDLEKALGILKEGIND
ncbi:outer membrane protein TolC [Algoriphagus ratkowskyi]|uniref:Outer membrane protein TolC n=1 Tax=Algoriphagus ratkowskyi TaxID=57028 RepID=A0A2W7RC74_9BACT|nr:TolC family protein [Algoriphagus ratkowskyi]PZX55910.1 outer membrane protein TolC [Algoriphagus ratkowskyi]TXD77270.1 TolC family protein [Algoriphagus ratkowskyi]